MSDSLVSIVAAARPNFMKVGPVLRALEGKTDVDLIHTGQHYDERMSQAFFDDLGIRRPDVNLEVGSGTHAEQTAGVLIGMERRLVEMQPAALLVVGDVNSTMAATLAASKLSIPVAHIEAGLRSRDWTMPEEINRVVTDRLSRWLLTPSADADENLLAEGVPREHIHLVGNVMIDTMLALLPSAREGFSATRSRLGLPERFATLTLHRPSNVDTYQLPGLLQAINQISQTLPIVFPVHPRTAQRLTGGEPRLGSGVIAVDPLGYREFLGLLDGSTIVLTDSGGLQEETSVLGVPCLTLRENTERPITCELGTNRIVGTDPAAVLEGFQDGLERERIPAEIPFWDGKAAERVVDVLGRDLGF